MAGGENANSQTSGASAVTADKGVLEQLDDIKRRLDEFSRRLDRASVQLRRMHRENSTLVDNCTSVVNQSMTQLATEEHRINAMILWQWCNTVHIETPAQVKLVWNIRDLLEHRFGSKCHSAMKLQMHLPETLEDVRSACALLLPPDLALPCCILLAEMAERHANGNNDNSKKKHS